MSSLPNNTKHTVANIFNSFLAAPSIGAAWEVGILDQLRDQKRLNVVDYSIREDLHIPSVQGMVTTLAIFHVLKREGQHIVPGSLFEDAYQTKSLFHFISLGQGDVFTRMQYNLRNKNRGGNFYTRDPAAISYACRDINERYIDPLFWTVMDGLSFEFSEVVDLGCGSGGRLMQILDHYPTARGIGIDIATPSNEVAKAEASKLGYAPRLRFVEGDVLKLDFRDDFKDVELLTCFMMGHDFWPRASAIETLRRLRESFPKIRRFILGDTTRCILGRGDPKYSITEEEVPVFSLGFEFVHALMGAYIPSLAEWDDAFAESGWRCVKRHFTSDRPPVWVVFELEHA